MARKRPVARDPKPEPGTARDQQLVFPFQLRVGDVILDAGDERTEVVGPPSTMVSGKMTRALVRREGDTVQREAVWEAWRKVRVVKRVAA